MNRLVGLLLLITSPLGAEFLVSDGYREAVFSVSDAAAYCAFMREVGAREEPHRGEVDRAVLAAWKLPDTASASEIVLGNPGTSRGYIRLVLQELKKAEGS